MTWAESPLGYLNLQRAQRITIEPNDQRPNEWAVLAHFGAHKHFVRSFKDRLEAGEWVADLLWGDDQ